MAARLPRIAILIAFIFSTKGALAATTPTTHYISKSLGTDTNNGTSKTTPWAHVPGMPSCTSNCASYSPVAGDSFVFRGGDTWVASDLGVNWSWSGTNAARIYVGVDQTWYSGSSWTRPIFTCGNSSCSNSAINQQIRIAGSYVTVDNIELTGLQQTNGAIQDIATFSDHTEVKNCYIHGWSRAAGQTNNGSSFAIVSNISNGEAQVAGSSFHDNVIDGTDTTRDMWNGIEFGESVYNNVIRYVVSGLLGDFTNVYSNLIENDVVSYAGDHCNLIFTFHPFNTATSEWAYNNVVRNSGCSGGEVFWLNGNAGCAGCTTYAYNNVVYNAGRGIDLGAHPTAGTTGTYYIVNNTVEAGGIACMGNGESPPRATVNFANTHCMNGTLCDSSGVTCSNQGGNLTQTLAQANAAGYTASETYAYSPTASNSPTVRFGLNNTGACSGNLAAMCSDTTYPEYDSVHHTVVMRTVVPRPASGAWDIGAYQFSSLQGQAPQPPTNLRAVLQ